MHDLIKEIAQVDDMEISDVLDAARKRYNELFPDWEVCTVSIEKSTDRNEQLERMIAMLQNMKAYDS